MEPEERCENMVTRNCKDFYLLMRRVLMADFALILQQLSRQKPGYSFFPELIRTFMNPGMKMKELLQEAEMNVAEGNSQIFRVENLLTVHLFAGDSPPRAVWNPRGSATETFRTLYEIAQHKNKVWIRVNLPTPVRHHGTLDNLPQQCFILFGLLGCKRTMDAMIDFMYRHVGTTQSRPLLAGEADMPALLQDVYGVMLDHYNPWRTVARASITQRFPASNTYYRFKNSALFRPFTPKEKLVLVQLDAMYGTWLDLHNSIPFRDEDEDED